MYWYPAFHQSKSSDQIVVQFEPSDENCNHHLFVLSAPVLKANLRTVTIQPLMVWADEEYDALVPPAVTVTLDTVRFIPVWYRSWAGVTLLIVLVAVVISDVVAFIATLCNTKFVPSYIKVFMLAVAISPSRGSLPSISLIDLAQRLFTLTVQAPVLAVANLSVSFIPSV